MIFNNEFYNQIKSTSMGKILDATYTTLSIVKEYVKENWNRFLNDCQIARLALKNYYSL